MRSIVRLGCSRIVPIWHAYRERDCPHLVLVAVVVVVVGCACIMPCATCCRCCSCCGTGDISDK